MRDDLHYNLVVITRNLGGSFYSKEGALICGHGISCEFFSQVLWDVVGFVFSRNRETN